MNKFSNLKRFICVFDKIINGLGIFLSTSYLLSFTCIMYSNKVFLNILQMSNLLCFQLLRKKLYWIIHHYDFMYAMNEFKFTNWRNFHFNWICIAPWLFCFFIYLSQRVYLEWSYLISGYISAIWIVYEELSFFTIFLSKCKTSCVDGLKVFLEWWKSNQHDKLKQLSVWYRG